MSRQSLPQSADRSGSPPHARRLFVCHCVQQCTQFIQVAPSTDGDRQLFHQTGRGGIWSCREIIIGDQTRQNRPGARFRGRQQSAHKPLIASVAQCQRDQQRCCFVTVRLAQGQGDLESDSGVRVFGALGKFPEDDVVVQPGRRKFHRIAADVRIGVVQRSHDIIARQCTQPVECPQRVQPRRSTVAAFQNSAHVRDRVFCLPTNEQTLAEELTPAVRVFEKLNRRGCIGRCLKRSRLRVLRSDPVNSASIFTGAPIQFCSDFRRQKLRVFDPQPIHVGQVECSVRTVREA